MDVPPTMPKLELRETILVLLLMRIAIRVHRTSSFREVRHVPRPSMTSCRGTRCILNFPFRGNTGRYGQRRARFRQVVRLSIG